MASDAMRQAWDYVDAHFEEKELFGEQGGDMIARLSAQVCAHPFRYGMALQTALLETRYLRHLCVSW